MTNYAYLMGFSYTNNEKFEDYKLSNALKYLKMKFYS